MEHLAILCIPDLLYPSKVFMCMFEVFFWLYVCLQVYLGVIVCVSVSVQEVIGETLGTPTVAIYYLLFTLDKFFCECMRCF